MAADDSAEAGRLRIAIIGSGVTGLLTAQGLKKNGCEVTVFERDAGFDAKSRDWSIHIHWAMPTLSKLLPEDVLEDMPKSMCNPYLEYNEQTELVPVYNGITGEVLFKLPTPGARRVSRQRLRKVFAKGLDIQWGKKLEELSRGGESDPVRLIFNDGSTYEASMVLGADGPQSKVREILLGIEAAKSLPSGFTIAVAEVNYGDAEKVEFIQNFHPVASLALHPDSTGGCGILEAKDPQDLSGWSTFWFKVWRGSVSMRGQEAIDFIKENTKGQCEPFNSAVAWTPDGSSCHIDEMRYWIPQGWDNRSGRVSLAGDAAHPMLPYRGQGLNHSMNDASNYVDTLVKIAAKPSSREEVMAAYDAEMIRRGAAAVKESLQEADYSLNTETIEKMLMVKQGLAKSA